MDVGRERETITKGHQTVPAMIAEARTMKRTASNAQRGAYKGSVPHAWGGRQPRKQNCTEFREKHVANSRRDENAEKGKSPN